VTRTIRVLAALGLAALAVLGLAVLGGAGPAAAAARADVTLTVSGDGAGGVTVLASYAADGRPFEQPLPLILTGTGDGGRSVGPLQLQPAAEGHGFYAATNILAPGRWQIVVTANQPQPLRAEAVIEARPAQVAPPPEELVAPPAAGGQPRWVWLATVPVAALLLATGFGLWRRRRTAAR
jgi:hypothetical protein